MNINDQQIANLLELVALTKDVETDCDHCLKHMAEFAEAQLSGKPIHAGLIAIDEHLQRCADCRDEFQALRDALSGESFT